PTVRGLGRLEDRLKSRVIKQKVRAWNIQDLTFFFLVRFKADYCLSVPSDSSTAASLCASDFSTESTKSSSLETVVSSVFFPSARDSACVVRAARDQSGWFSKSSLISAASSGLSMSFFFKAVTEMPSFCATTGRGYGPVRRSSDSHSGGLVCKSRSSACVIARS